MVTPEEVPATPAAVDAPVAEAVPVAVAVPVAAAVPVAEAVPVVQPVVVEKLPPPASGIFLGTGRRKTSIARIRLVRPGNGKITINGKPLTDWFNRPVHLQHIQEPLTVTQMEKAVDIVGDVVGGGVTGQAGALRHGIARALLAFSPDFRRTLRRAGCLTRDPRAKERRKPGLKKARKAEQYSKR